MKVNEFKVIKSIEGISVEALDAVPPYHKSGQLSQPLYHSRGKVGDEIRGEIKKTDPARILNLVNKFRPQFIPYMGLW